MLTAVDMVSFTLKEPDAHFSEPVELRRVYRWRYRDPVMGMVAQFKLMAPDEALELDTAATIIPGSEVVIEERRPGAKGIPIWRKLHTHTTGKCCVTVVRSHVCGEGVGPVRMSPSSGQYSPRGSRPRSCVESAHPCCHGGTRCAHVRPDRRRFHARGSGWALRRAGARRSLRDVFALHSRPDSVAMAEDD